MHQSFISSDLLGQVLWAFWLIHVWAHQHVSCKPMAGFANSALLDSDLCRVKVVSEDRGFWLNRDRLVKPGAFASLSFSVSGLQATCSSHEGCLSPLMFNVSDSLYLYCWSAHQPQTSGNWWLTAHTHESQIVIGGDKKYYDYSVLQKYPQLCVHWVVFHWVCPAARQ